MSGILQDYGIRTDGEIRFAIDESGRVRLASDHPQRSRIEALIQGSPLLGDAVTAILADTHRITMAALAQKGKATPELSNALRQGLTLVMARTQDKFVSEVRYNGSVLATSDGNRDWLALLAAMEKANQDFDRAEEERRLEYERSMSQLKRLDEARRIEAKTVKDQAIADKLSEMEAAERRANLHPEQGHTPIFI
jgi:hypothetical protein